MVERELAAREAGTSHNAAPGDPRPAAGAPDDAGGPDLWALLRDPPGGDGGTSGDGTGDDGSGDHGSGEPGGSPGWA
jgi:hypothetical protein